MAYNIPGKALFVPVFIYLFLFNYQLFLDFVIVYFLILSKFYVFLCSWRKLASRLPLKSQIDVQVFYFSYVIHFSSKVYDKANEIILIII